MQSWEDAKKAQLRRDYPGWDIWYIRHTQSRRTLWCAKPSGAPVAIFHAWTPGELVTKLDAALALLGFPPGHSRPHSGNYDDQALAGQDSEHFGRGVPGNPVFLLELETRRYRVSLCQLPAFDPVPDYPRYLEVAGYRG